MRRWVRWKWWLWHSAAVVAAVAAPSACQSACAVEVPSACAVEVPSACAVAVPSACAVAASSRVVAASALAGNREEGSLDTMGNQDMTYLWGPRCCALEEASSERCCGLQKGTAVGQQGAARGVRRARAPAAFAGAADCCGVWVYIFLWSCQKSALHAPAAACRTDHKRPLAGTRDAACTTRRPVRCGHVLSSSLTTGEPPSSWYNAFCNCGLCSSFRLQNWKDRKSYVDFNVAISILQNSRERFSPHQCRGGQSKLSEDRDADAQMMEFIG